MAPLFFPFCFVPGLTRTYSFLGFRTVSSSASLENVLQLQTILLVHLRMVLFPSFSLLLHRASPRSPQASPRSVNLCKQPQTHTYNLAPFRMICLPHIHPIGPLRHQRSLTSPRPPPPSLRPQAWVQRDFFFFVGTSHAFGNSPTNTNFVFSCQELEFEFES